MSGHNQFALLKQRRFLPFFIVQSLGAFNDNIYRQAIIGLLFYLGVSPQERTLYTNLAPALFILPYFLFSAKQDSVGVLQNLFPAFTALYSLRLDIKHRGWRRDRGD